MFRYRLYQNLIHSGIEVFSNPPYYNDVIPENELSKIKENLAEYKNKFEFMHKLKIKCFFDTLKKNGGDIDLCDKNLDNLKKNQYDIKDVLNTCNMLKDKYPIQFERFSDTMFCGIIFLATMFLCKFYIRLCQ